MTLDIPHMAVTAVLIFIVLWVVGHASPFENMTRGRKTLTQFVLLFIVLFILNLVWPYGSGT